MSTLVGTRVVILAADLFEESELIYPLHRLREEGAEVIVASPTGADVKSKHGYPVRADMAIEKVDGQSVDGVVVVGGYSPDIVRRSDPALKLLRQLHESEKLVAFICHGGWVPISAGILGGRRATSVSAIKDDMVNAGVVYEDTPVVIDGNLVSARVPAESRTMVADHDRLSRKEAANLTVRLLVAL